MQETQRTIGEWARATFPGGDDLSPRHCLRLLEEVVELCASAGAGYPEVMDSVLDAIQSVRRGSGRFRAAPSDPAVVAAEMADCAIVLDVLAERRGVDLRAEVDRKMAINRARRWKANGDGTGYHIKEQR